MTKLVLFWQRWTWLRKTVVVVIVELPHLLCTVIGRKPANLPQEGDDIRGIHLDKFPVGQERLPKGYCSDAQNRYGTSWPALYQECPSKTRGVIAFTRVKGLVWRVWYFLGCVCPDLARFATPLAVQALPGEFVRQFLKPSPRWRKIVVLCAAVCNKWFHERGQEFIRRCSVSAA